MTAPTPFDSLTSLNGSPTQSSDRLIPEPVSPLASPERAHVASHHTPRADGSTTSPRPLISPSGSSASVSTPPPSWRPLFSPSGSSTSILTPPPRPVFSPSGSSTSIMSPPPPYENFRRTQSTQSLMSPSSSGFFLEPPISIDDYGSSKEKSGFGIEARTDVFGVEPKRKRDVTGLLGLGISEEGKGESETPSDQLSVKEAYLPVDTQDLRRAREKEAERTAEQHSRRVRRWMIVLLSFFIASCVVNTTVNCIGMVKTVPGWSELSRITPINAALVVFPRLLMLVASLATIIPFLFMILWYKEEPWLHLADYMDPSQYPGVDVLLPRYKEDWELFRPVVIAALGMDYPSDRLMVHICDDGSRGPQSLRAVVEPLMALYPNLRYVTRTNGQDAKAGNLNNAMSQSSNPLIVVLDADHIAEPEFLLRIVPHLLAKDGDHRIPKLSNKVAFVQTTQVFHNERLPLVRMLDGSHALFYKLMMPSYSGMGVSLCVGTGYVMQRKAIEDIGGGYVCSCAVEDVVTALALHDRGWTSKYLECRLAIGLSPETLSEFFAQRQRWVAGSAQLLLYKNPMEKRHIPLKARIAYLVGTWYWLVMIVFVFLVMARLLSWLTYRAVTQNPIEHPLPLIMEYIPFYIMFMLLPKVSVEEKVFNLTSLVAFFPTFLSVFWGLLRGQLDPAKYTFKVTSSSEAFGNAWPKLANFNIAFVVLTTLLYAMIAIPQFQISTSITDYVVPALILLWVLMNNFPVLFDVGVRVVRWLRRSNASNLPVVSLP